MKSRKQYLGDGVYVDIENGMVKLTTENGVDATNTIFLELEVYDALTEYMTRQSLAAAQPKSDDDADDDGGYF